MVGAPALAIVAPRSRLVGSIGPLKSFAVPEQPVLVPAVAASTIIAITLLDVIMGTS
jgi:low affinity Fe/Cu permease